MSMNTDGSLPMLPEQEKQSDPERRDLAKELEELEEVLLIHQKRYPQSRVQDWIKLICQNEFGGGHLIQDEEASLRFLQEERGSLLNGNLPHPFIWFEPVGRKLCRMHLTPVSNDEADNTTLNRFFVLTANQIKGSGEGLQNKLQLLLRLCREGKLPSSETKMTKYLETYQMDGYPVLHHSPRYRQKYRPAYRIVHEIFGRYYPVFSAVDRLLRRQDRMILAIDGRCGSGKTTLALLLRQVYGCGVICMDHFFLRPEQRTKERLSEPGGNIDRERFIEEVSIHLQNWASFSYHKFDCKDGSLTQSVSVEASRILVVEGTYSMHPGLKFSPDLSVFLTISPETQAERILRRNGETELRKFQEHWIPLEEAYFQEMQVSSRCTICLS